MELIIGGAYQGKRAYAKKRFPQAVWEDGESCTLEGLLAADGVYHFHVFLDRQMRAGADVQGLPELIMEKNPDLVVVLPAGQKGRPGTSGGLRNRDGDQGCLGSCCCVILLQRGI